MSEWRLRGYVQDSDEEEEDLDTLSTNSSDPPQDAQNERVDATSVAPQQLTGFPPDNDNDHANGYDDPQHIFVQLNDPTGGANQSYSNPTPITSSVAGSQEQVDKHGGGSGNVPVYETSTELTLLEDNSPSIASNIERGCEQTKNPDPLQRSSGPIERDPVSVPLNPHDDTTALFGLELLSNSSQSLSDPPSDDESGIIFASPQYRTEVQVVIPRPTVSESHSAGGRASRAFRARKPIQLHPYLLEGERYRQELQTRGIIPVPRVRSPPRRTADDKTETQEQDFNPEDVGISNSPPELVWPTPVRGRGRDDELAGISVGRSRHTHSKKNTTSRLSLTQPTSHVAINHKTRRLNPPSTQGVTSSRHVIEHRNRSIHQASRGGIPSAHGIWNIPQSPPYSSSPPGNGIDFALRTSLKPISNATRTNLPTPSNSSSIQDDLPLDRDSESDSDLPSTRRPNRFRLVPSLIHSSPSGSNKSDNGSESEVEVRRIGKKIKGVLPASWLRLDRQAQEKSKLKPQVRTRAASTLSPERSTAQPGVAQRIARETQKATRTITPGQHSEEFVVISDDSENESVSPFLGHSEDAQNSAREVSEMAAQLDSRNVDDDLASMENDRLHLFTLDGDRTKRKRQTRLTDVFHKYKKIKFTDDGPRGPKVSGAPRNAHAQRRAQTPPALSIIDLDRTPTKNNEPVPQFVRVAMRCARKRKDEGRQSPNHKHIRLQTYRDTGDVDIMFEHWRKGSIKPKASSRVREERQHRQQRQPLVDRHVNQLSTEQRPIPEKESVIEQHGSTIIRPIEMQNPPNHKIKKFTSQRTSSMLGRVAVPRSDSSNLRRRFPQVFSLNNASFRTGQLEGLESEFGRQNLKAVFEQGLQQADQQFAFQLPRGEPSINPQLARFLADDDATVPVLPLAKDIVEGDVQLTPAPAQEKRCRIARKIRARRIDVETREYRQPSEPAVVDFVDGGVMDEATEQEQDDNSLQGLGSFGTRYPTTFDISPLPVGMYFHPNTFVGANALARALETTRRDMDSPAGQSSIRCHSETLECGPWSDETYFRLSGILDGIWRPLDDQTLTKHETSPDNMTALERISALLQSVIEYFSLKLSFLDPIDRQDFATRMKQLLECQLNNVVRIHIVHTSQSLPTTPGGQLSLRIMAYLLVLATQIHKIAQHVTVEPSTCSSISILITKVAKVIIQNIVRGGISELGGFLERSRRYQERENGIQNKDPLVEYLVICMHTLANVNIPGSTFWDIVSQELSQKIEKATHVKTFESIWATVFTLLPFVEFDASGLLLVNRRSALGNDNWNFIKQLLKRLFLLYPSSRKTRSSSLNEYVRATLTRCHVLIDTWHWERCDPMLSMVFDFFGKNGLRQLQREGSKGSARFLECLEKEPPLNVEANDSAFHIYLKCLAQGLKGIRNIYTEKKIRSVVFRCTPNHGRSYPKDQSLDQESLDALRNHHDLLCTLYWASPPSCRPKLDLIRGLVHHEQSHREACRLNVKAWANLTMFQLSTDEAYSALQPFAAWHKEIMQQTLNQYRLAKSEAEDYMRSVEQDGTTDISVHLVRATMEKNQEQVIGTLRDCIAGLHKAVKHGARKASLKDFLMDCGIVKLLELAHVEDPRLTVVIRETLAIFRDYATLEKLSAAEQVSQPTSEESQDYGDFPDLDDLNVDQQESQSSSLGFIQIPLWHLLSNAFGAERAPDDNLLMDCIDTWVLVASHQVSAGERTWSHYIESFSQVSWHQFRDTEQTRKFRPYFMAVLLAYDSSAYSEHPLEFLGVLLISLAERESMLRFQYHLLQAIVQADLLHPLVQNLPFYRNDRTGQLDITPDTLRTRRLALLSSIFANMRENVHAVMLEDSGRVAETKRGYALLLKDFMSAMKTNYQRLHQGTTTTGAYVEFVQKVVQFLKQYTSDICPVNSFFTDSVTFPLPATDPTYVVARLCGYAPKLANAGVIKQLSTFVQTVAQQAALDNQQPYLVQQLSTALSDAGGRAMDRLTLRSALLQGIFPAYVEVAFASATGLVIAKPILQALSPILEAMRFDVRVADGFSIEGVCNNVWSICNAFMRSTEDLRRDPLLLKKSYVLRSVTLLIKTVTSMIPLLDYIGGRTLVRTRKPAIIHYFSDFNVFIAELLHDMMPHVIPTFDFTESPASPYSGLLLSCTRDLRNSMKSYWGENQDRIFFGHGQTRREVVVDMGSTEEESSVLIRTIEVFHCAVAAVYGDEVGNTERGGEILDDIFV